MYVAFEVGNGVLVDCTTESHQIQTSVHFLFAMRPLIGTQLATPKPIYGVPLVSPLSSSRTVGRTLTPCIRMSIVAPPVPLEIKGFEGEVVGTDSLSLKVADPETAKGLVHRYVVKVRRDMRKAKNHGRDLAWMDDAS